MSNGVGVHKALTTHKSKNNTCIKKDKWYFDTSQYNLIN